VVIPPLVIPAVAVNMSGKIAGALFSMNTSRQFFLATVSSAALVGSAAAADLPYPTKAPPPTPPVAWSWAGPYVGLNLGAAQNHWSYTDVDDFAFVLVPGGLNDKFWSDSRTEFTGGGQIGYNWQLNNIVLGAVADVNWIAGSASANFPAIAPVSGTTKIDWLTTFRGRLGVAFSNVLFYGTGGLAVARISDNWGLASAGSNNFTSSGTRTAPVFGGGVEYMFAQHWTAGVEVLYANFGTQTASTVYAGPTYRTNFEHSVTLVRGALNFKW
jgi:outer membrane immunogenic protein